MQTTTQQDADFYHDLVTGRTMSGIPHCVNQMPIASLCKKKKNVEAAICGSVCTMYIPVEGPA